MCNVYLREDIWLVNLDWIFINPFERINMIS